MIEYEITEFDDYGNCMIDGTIDGNIVNITTITDGKFVCCNVFSETNLARTDIIARFVCKLKT